MNYKLKSRDKPNTTILDRLNTKISNKTDITKKRDCENRVFAQTNNRTDFLKRYIFLKKIVIAILE